MPKESEFIEVTKFGVCRSISLELAKPADVICLLRGKDMSMSISTVVVFLLSKNADINLSLRSGSFGVH